MSEQVHHVVEVDWIVLCAHYMEVGEPNGRTVRGILLWLSDRLEELTGRKPPRIVAPDGTTLVNGSAGPVFITANEEVIHATDYTG